MYVIFILVRLLSTLLLPFIVPERLPLACGERAGLVRLLASGLAFLGYGEYRSPRSRFSVQISIFLPPLKRVRNGKIGKKRQLPEKRV